MSDVNAIGSPILSTTFTTDAAGCFNLGSPFQVTDKVGMRSMRSTNSLANKVVVVSNSDASPVGAGIISTVASIDTAREIRITASPTPQPSPRPTQLNLGFVAIDTTVVMTTDSAIGGARRRLLATGTQTQLKATTAAQLGVAVSALSSYVFTQTSRTQTLFGQSATTWTWTQSFTLIANPSQFNTGSAAGVEAFIKSSIGPTSTSYASKVKADMQLKTSPVVTSATTANNPSAAAAANTKSTVPTMMPNRPKPNDGGLSGPEMAGVAIGAIVFAILLFGSAFLAYQRIKNPSGSIQTCYREGSSRESDFTKASKSKPSTLKELESNVDYPATMSGGYELNSVGNRRRDV